jgi:adenine-specific DNA-methyltransferase
MEKLKCHTPDFTAENIQKLAALFPNCVVEAKDAQGKPTKAIDFDQLRQELAASVVEGPQERYRLDWPGKREALLTANAPIAKTLRPCRDESVNFDSTKNLFIEGDNLDALKLLQETYLGKVGFIYIDPPYNTGNDFIYEDDFAETSDAFLLLSNQKDDRGNRLVTNPDSNGRFHSDWMSMLYSRLKLARNLLTEDGVVFVSIDEGEVANLRKIADEVFGENNFVAQLVWKKSYGGGAKSKHAVVLHEYILMYCREKDQLPVIELPANDEVLKYYKFKDEKHSTRGPYRKQPLATNSMDARPNLRFAIKWNGQEIWPEKQWQWSPERVEQALQNDELVFTKRDQGWTVDYKQYLRNTDGEVRGSKLYSILEGPYTQVGTSEIAEIFGDGKVFSFPKPSELIQLLLGCAPQNAVVLDFFAGSGTTAHAAMALNAKDGGSRRCILVQLPEPCEVDNQAFKSGFRNIAEVTKERVRRVGQHLVTTSLFGAKTDTGFRVLKVDSSNMKDVYYAPDTVKQSDLVAHADNIKGDRMPEDLLFQVLVDWGVDLALPIAKESIAGKTVFFVDGDALAACFDASISEELVKELAKRKPLRAVFRDSSYGSDSVKINVEQIFKLLSPATEIKSL